MCTLSGSHRTRKAIFEFDKLVRSIYTLRYLRDPQLQRNVHRSQNRIEAYHQLRSALAHVGGKKELIGRTDLDVAIGNEYGRLVANTIIAYNSMLLSGLLTRYQTADNRKALELLLVPFRNNIIFAVETAISGSRFGRHHTRMRRPPPESNGRRGQVLADWKTAVVV
jgi:hypothetical protein